MPQIPSSDMAELAKRWRRGKEVFRQLFDVGSIDPETKTPTYVKKEVADEELLRLSKECKLEGLIDFIHDKASEKTARAAYYTMILCLGSRIMQKEAAGGEVIE